MKMRIVPVNNPLKVLTISLLLLFIGLGSFLRFHHIGKLSFWNDEAYTVINSRASLINPQGSLIKAIENEPNMSLYEVLAYFWIRFFPNASEGMLRALSAIFSIAGIPAVFLLGKTMAADQKKAAAIGLIAALLVTINAYHVEYAQEFRSYSLTFLLTTLSTFLFIKTIEDPGSKYFWPIGYTLVTAAAVYSHFYVIFLVAAQAVTLPILLLDKKKHSLAFKRMLYCGIGIVCLILPITFLDYLIYRKEPGLLSFEKLMSHERVPKAQIYP